MCGGSLDVSMWGLLREYRKWVVFYLLGFRGYVDVSVTYGVWGIYICGLCGVRYVRWVVEVGISKSFLKIRWYEFFEVVINCLKMGIIKKF